MYCKFAIFILSLLSFSATALESPQWPDAYARRDYKLGMSLTDFRNFPYPDQEKWPNSYPIASSLARITCASSATSTQPIIVQFLNSVITEFLFIL